MTSRQVEGSRSGQPHRRSEWSELVEVVRALEGRLEASDEGSAELVRRARERLDRGRVRVTFGGLFKAGKSTLVNGLLGREVLPSDALPETGVPCRVRSGAEDTGHVISDGVRSTLRCDPESIRTVTGLVDGRGLRRDDTLRGIHHVELTLAGSRLAETVEWIDSPGIDDTEAMDAVAVRAAEEADLLVWVLSSRHPLSEPEMDFLAGYLEDAGPSGLVLALNVIGAQKDGSGGSPSVGRLLRSLEPKLDRFWHACGLPREELPRVYAIDAGELVARRNEIPPGSEADRLLDEIARPEPRRIRRCRASRVLPILDLACGSLRDRLARARGGVEAGNRARRERAQAEREVVRRPVNSALRRYASGVRTDLEAGVRGAILGLRQGHLDGVDPHLPIAAARGPRAELTTELREALPEAVGGASLDTVLEDLEASLQPLPLPPLEAVVGCPSAERPGTSPVDQIGRLAAAPLVALGAAVDRMAPHLREAERRRRTIRAVEEALPRAVEWILEDLEHRLEASEERLVETWASASASWEGTADAVVRLGAWEELAAAAERCRDLAAAWTETAPPEADGDPIAVWRLAQSGTVPVRHTGGEEAP